MTTITVPEKFTAKVRGQDFAIEALDTLPQASLEKIFAYGLQRIFNDAAASATAGLDMDAEGNDVKAAAIALELAGKRLDSLRSGALRASPNRIGDPVKAEAMRDATARVEAAYRKGGFKLKDVGAATIREKAEALLVKNPQLLEAARAAIAAKAELEIDIEI